MKLHLNKRKIILCLLMGLSIFQVFVYVNENSKVKTVESIKIIEKQPELDFNHTIKELKKIRNLDIIEITNKESKKIGVNISGNYDESIQSLNILKKYKITNYKVDFDGKTYDVFAEIS
ncbi:hypothetical protein [Clostridium chrysemydis]|uniref:hypothetical protein n=1 Tax=Clostridium chrysemydis TaxID=2665504 RepID=UPI001883DC49|nr:hypothetical protein [Clostridium chrysemydis]